MPQSRLFKPLKIGDMEVKHRIGMAPLTRFRATDDRTPTPLMKEYYSQRAAIPGTLIITEGTFVSAGGGFANAPGLWRDDQVAAWRTITDEVHRKGCSIVCQIFAMGRAADAETAQKEGFKIQAPSPIPISPGDPIPHAMTLSEIHQTTQHFVHASQNAIRAGFDAVEVHAANGYLVDQFLQDVSNTRDDAYGGSIENRSRLLADILTAVTAAIGPERVGLRLSPWSTFQGMGMKDPIPQLENVVAVAKRAKLAYLHLVESRISGSDDIEHHLNHGHHKLDFAYKLWDGPFLIAGGYTPDEARELVDVMYPDKEILVLFGRYFIANPDLVYRVKEGVELNAYDRKSFYTVGAKEGYVDYEFSEKFLAEGVEG